MAQIGASKQFWITLVALTAWGCAATFSPTPIDQVSYLERAQTEEQGGLKVTVAVLNRDESKEVFGVDLATKGVQPVWVDIENNADIPFAFLPITLDQNYFSANEVAWLNHFKMGRAANEQMDVLFEDLAFESTYLLPGKRKAGFVYTNLDPAIKYVNIALYGLDRLERFIFYFQVPGIQTDYQVVDFHGLYSDREIVDYRTEEELRGVLESIECCTTSEDGRELGNALNVVIIGDPEDMFAAFVRRRWDVTEAKSEEFKLDFDKIFNTARYRTQPMSNQYLYGRRQDIGFQKSRQTEGTLYRQRNEVRLWLAPFRYRGDYVWLGSIIRDIGSDLRVRKYWFMSQEIDPDVDEIRDFLAEDLVFSQGVNKSGYVAGVGRATREKPHSNFYGQPWWTDGYRAVLIVGDELSSWTELEHFEWEDVDDGYLNRGNVEELK